MTNKADPRLERLQRRLSGLQLGRRDFIVAALAMGTTLPTAIAFADKAQAATPKKGGHFRFGTAGGATVDALDPATWTNAMMSFMSHAMCNTLTELTPDGRIVGDLAESFESSADAKTWRFKLRSGVEFHNGKSLSVEDVITSFNWHSREDSKSGVRSIVEQIESYAADGDDTVVFQLKTGNADFPAVLIDYHLVVFPAKDGAPDFADGVGTGGFVLKSFEPGVRAEFERNPNYWKDGRAHFSSVEVLSIRDAAARQSALLGGDVDATENVDLKTAHLIERAPNVRLLSVTGGLHHTWPMRVDAAPFDNIDFRLAIKHAVDRNELVDKIFRGFAGLGNDHPVAQSMPFFDDSIEQRERDLDRAKHHLEKSGHAGAQIQLSAADVYAGTVDAALLIQSQLAQVGIDVEVVREATDGYWSNVWRRKPWCAAYWNGRPTADGILTAAYAAEAAYNASGWVNIRFNELLVAARAETDTSLRAEMYAEMQRLVRDDGATLIPSFGAFVMALNDKIATPDSINGNWTADGGRAAERWWTA